MKLGELLRLYRAVHKLSLREFAKEIGVNVPFLSRLENGHPIRTENLMKLLNWLMKETP